MTIVRFIGILLTITVPLQGLAVPHCHGEHVTEQGSNHVQTPHFHFGRSHHHGGHGHSHRHSDCPADMAEEASSEVPTEQHDDDAVYLTSDLVVDHTQVRVTTRCVCVALCIEVIAPGLAEDIISCRARKPPPDIGGFPILLKTASLRL